MIAVVLSLGWERWAGLVIWSDLIQITSYAKLLFKMYPSCTGSGRNLTFPALCLHSHGAATDW